MRGEILNARDDEMAAKQIVDESELTKMQVRKLNALRKSVGDDIGEDAFLKWLRTQDLSGPDVDPNIELIADTLGDVRDSLRIPRGVAYLVKQGRGRLIVETVAVEPKAQPKTRRTRKKKAA